MPNVFSELLFGNGPSAEGLADVIAPRRTFDDVILPPATRRALEHALVQIEKHDLLYRDWGLAERHQTGLGLAFNFAGPPGTGKTICAEALAHRLGRQLMIVRQADLQSMWVGQTGKNVTSVFRAAARQGAVLLFDEADAVAARRFTGMSHGYEREANAVVSVLLRELEEHTGVVIFATNLAANFDPAFERRIRTHVLFEMPDVKARERIWKVQLHAQKTPLARDVDFRTLAERYEVSGGDIKNAVLKAAQAAIAEPGPDAEKRIHQRHFVEGMENVLESKVVMQQSLFDDRGDLPWSEALAGFSSDTSLETLFEEQEALTDRQHVLEGAVELVEEELSAFESAQQKLSRQVETIQKQQERHERERRLLFAFLFAALLAAAGAFVAALLL